MKWSTFFHKGYLFILSLILFFGYKLCFSSVVGYFLAVPSGTFVTTFRQCSAPTDYKMLILRLDMAHFSKRVDKNGAKVEPTRKYQVYEELDRPKTGILWRKGQSNSRQYLGLHFYSLIKGDRALWRSG